MTSWSGIPELKQGYQVLGPAKFISTMAALLVYVGAFAWLSIELDHPQVFGSTCSRKCMIEGFWYSPSLLTHGGWKAYALFAFYWSLPAMVIGSVSRAFIKKRRAASRIRIKPLFPE